MFDQMTERARTAKQPALRAVTNRIESVGGINLSQGKCALPVHPIVKAASIRAVEEGWNTATLRNGAEPLRAQLARRYAQENGHSVTLDQIAVTHGVTGALECIFRMFLDPGDEVVLFRPAFPYYEKMLRLRGGVPVYVTLSGPDWRFDPEALAAAFSPKTKLVVFCTPSNPTGKVFSRGELEQVADLCRKHSVVAISDEVYQNHLADGQAHVSIASLDDMFEHAITLSSVSKTFFATGWRVGWAIGPARVMESFSVHSDQLFLCANSIMQYAAAYAYEDLPEEYFSTLRLPFNRRQAQLRQTLVKCGFDVITPQGGYFVMARYGELGFDDDDAAVDALIKQAQIGVAPGYSFEPEPGNQSGYLRFSCAITDEEMDKACTNLQGL